MLERELPEFLRALNTSTSRLPARTAAWMCLRLAVRSGMLRFAEWSEFDLANATWIVLASKMKMNRDYMTPLPTQVVAALQDLHRVTGAGRWVFPGVGPKNPTMSENTICKVFASVG